MKILSVFLLVLLTSCATKPNATPIPPNTMVINELAPNKWTALTRQNLEHLLMVYSLTPFIYTYEVDIQSRVVPHSHPVLTLNTRYAENPHKILAVFLHEQLHWWGEKNKMNMNKAIKDLRAIFPGQNHSTYLHLVICTLEYDALVTYLEKKETTKIFREFINKDKIYPWIYTQVLNRYAEINKVIVKYKLKPEALQKPTKKPPLSLDKRLKKR